MEMFYTEIASGVLKIIVALIGILMTAVVLPWLKGSAFPWLRDKQLYSTAKKFAQAAEKLAETGAIDRGDKLDYVVGLLIRKGFEIDDVTRAFIESAVKEIDMAVLQGVSEIADAFDESEVRSNDDEAAG